MIAALPYPATADAVRRGTTTEIVGCKPKAVTEPAPEVAPVGTLGTAAKPCAVIVATPGAAFTFADAVAGSPLDVNAPAPVVTLADVPIEIAGCLPCAVAAPSPAADDTEADGEGVEPDALAAPEPRVTETAKLTDTCLALLRNRTSPDIRQGCAIYCYWLLALRIYRTCAGGCVHGTACHGLASR